LLPARHTSYDAVPYHGAVVPLTSPLHLGLCSCWHHAVRSSLHSFHATEIGCGDGANLVPMAFYRQDSTFTGVDSCASALDRARQAAKFLGLTNIRFYQQDVRALDPADFEPCDFIIVHGLYSWVPDDARDAILNFCRHTLAPSGLTYISYNAQPGWATRRVVRETLLRARRVREAGTEQKAEKAIEAAVHLLEDLPTRDCASGVLLAEELERVRNGKPFYVFHEYLAEVNDGFWLGDFVERARRHGLEYVTDAQFCRWEGRVPENLKSALAKRDLDCIEQEETADLLCDRYFRASILCRADAPRVSTCHRDLLDQVHLATSLSFQAGAFNLIDGEVARFLGTGGSEITLTASITKAAVVLLAARWPRGMRLEALYGSASEFLAENGGELSGDARWQLSDDLMTLFEAGQIDLRLREPAYHNDAPGHPQAHALARFEAEHRDALATPYHLPIAFDPPALAFVRGLDGSRSRSELQRVFGEELVTQTLEVMGRWGLLNE